MSFDIKAVRCKVYNVKCAMCLQCVCTAFDLADSRSLEPFVCANENKSLSNEIVRSSKMDY